MITPVETFDFSITCVGQNIPPSPAGRIPRGGVTYRSSMRSTKNQLTHPRLKDLLSAYWNKLLEQNMPLVNIVNGKARRCTATCKRTKERCWNLAAWDCSTCRYHGARRPESIKRGSAHPQFRHGRETTAARRLRVEGMSRLRRLVDLAADAGFVQKRITGRRAG